MRFAVSIRVHISAPALCNGVQIVTASVGAARIAFDLDVDSRQANDRRLMRSHAQIIRDAGGYKIVHNKLHWTGKSPTVKSWVLRDNIPAEHWRALVDQGICSLDELATWASTKKFRAAS
jgi:hypothetical protein